MDQSPEKIQKWLDEHKNMVLNIRKEEDGDLDSARMRLKDVKFVRHEDTDDYLSDQAFLLIGEGSIDTDTGPEEVPAQTFEIALTDRWFSAVDNHGLHLNTERGSYAIELENEDN